METNDLLRWFWDCPRPGERGRWNPEVPQSIMWVIFFWIPSFCLLVNKSCHHFTHIFAAFFPELLIEIISQRVGKNIILSFSWGTRREEQAVLPPKAFMMKKEERGGCCSMRYKKQLHLTVLCRNSNWELQVTLSPS